MTVAPRLASAIIPMALSPHSYAFSGNDSEVRTLFGSRRALLNDGPVRFADDAAEVVPTLCATTSPYKKYTTFLRPARMRCSRAGFDDCCNGVALLRNFDVFKEAGGVNRALVSAFLGLEANAAGHILLGFVPARNYAGLNAIEVIDESK